MLFFIYIFRYTSCWWKIAGCYYLSVVKSWSVWSDGWLLIAVIHYIDIRYIGRLSMNWIVNRWMWVCIARAIHRLMKCSHLLHWVYDRRDVAWCPPVCLSACLPACGLHAAEPSGFSEDEPSLFRRRAVELKHGRVRARNKKKLCQARDSISLAMLPMRSVQSRGERCDRAGRSIGRPLIVVIWRAEEMMNTLFLERFCSSPSWPHLEKTSY